MNEVIDHITNKIGTEPVSYELVDWPDIKTLTNCLLWKLPPPTEEDKSILQLDSELTEKLYTLVKDTPDSPEIQEIVKKQAQLLEGVKFFKKSFYTSNDLIALGGKKGIRKEWWDLRNYAKEKQRSLFLGYSSATLQLQKSQMKSY